MNALNAELAVISAAGACRGMDPNLFHPTRGESSNEALAVCAGCPVREACLDYALTTGQEFGVWGGMTKKARDRERRARMAAGDALAVACRRPSCDALFQPRTAWDHYCSDDCRAAARRDSQRRYNARHSAA